MSRTPKQGRGLDATIHTRQSLLLEGEVVDQLHAEAQRLDSTASRLFRRAWRIARAQMAQMPAWEPYCQDLRHVHLYLCVEMLAEVEREARRLDRPMGWVLWRAWKIARAEITQAPVPQDEP